MKGEVRIMSEDRGIDMTVDTTNVWSVVESATKILMATWSVMIVV